MANETMFDALPQSWRNKAHLNHLEYIDWVLDELLQGSKVPNRKLPDRDVERAKKYVESIRKEFLPQE